MSTDKSERPKSRIGGLSSVFKTLGRSGGKKDKNQVGPQVAIPQRAVLGETLSAYHEVPPVPRRCLEFLESEEVYKIESFSLQAPSHNEVQRLIKQFEENDAESVNLAGELPDTVCGVLRRWLRSLTEPALSFEFYDTWMAIQQGTAQGEVLSEIQGVLFQLHPTHYLIVARILRFLHKLYFHGNINKLNAVNLGLSWQPSLIWSPQQQSNALDTMRFAADGGMSGSIVSVMIQNFESLFIEELGFTNSDSFDYSDSAASASTAAEPNQQQLPHQPAPSTTSAAPVITTNPPTASSSATSVPASHTHPTGPEHFSTEAYAPLGTTIQPLACPSSTQASSTPSTSYSTSATSSATSAQPLPPLIIPQNSVGLTNHSQSVPVTPMTPMSPMIPTPTNSNTLHKSMQPQRQNSSDQLSSPRAAAASAPARKKQLVIVNGYTQATALCDFYDPTEGILSFVKNDTIYVTGKHEDGWWEGWKRGRRGFFPAHFVIEAFI